MSESRLTEPSSDLTNLPNVSSKKAKASLLTWLQLMRLPTVFTAISNILCGYLITHALKVRDLPAETNLALLLLSTFGLYMGGMVLNDVFDAKLDAKERPERPIPSGKISLTAATVFGVGLTALGVAAAAMTGKPSLLIALLIVPSVLLYNAVLKSTNAAPFGMAVCRFLNLMLGASAVAEIAGLLQRVPLQVASALGIYILGVTFFAKNEAGNIRKSGLIVGVALVLCGIGLNAWTVYRFGATESVIQGSLMALLLLSLNLLMRTSAVISNPAPRRIQQTVGLMLMSVIFLDAIMVFALTGDSKLAAITIVLVAPASLIRKVVPMS